MSSIREQIESFLYPHLEKFTDMVYRGGTDTEFMGIRVMDDKERFTHGALVGSACILYAHYVRVADPRAELALERLIRFIEIAASGACKTWGKLGILRGFNLLSERGLLSKIPKELIEAMKVKTDYEDFFDKQSLELRGMATNYLQVALACAGYRERLGWENEGFSSKISDLLTEILECGTDGWMDDEIPYGRFDRYSFVLSSEFADTACDIHLPLPTVVRENLRQSAQKMLFMANGAGDGILYGRSVACHGDAAVGEILCSALAHKLIPEEQVSLALYYIKSCINKITDFWYDSERGTFNIWYGGRSTNRYRSVARILEVNLDMSIHLFTTLKNLERTGVADMGVSVQPTVAHRDAGWTAQTVTFSRGEGGIHATVILRRGERIAFLPFVGLGKAWGLRNAYYPFPVIARLIEASPTAEYPFFTPEYTDRDGNKYRPCQYFSDLRVEEVAGRVTVRAEGYLSLCDGNLPRRTDIPFRHTVIFDGENIEMMTETDGDFIKAQTYFGVTGERVSLDPVGYESSELRSPTSDTDGIHGRILRLRLCTSGKTASLGCKITIPL